MDGPDRSPTHAKLEFHRSPELTLQVLPYSDALPNLRSETAGLPVHSYVQGRLIDRDEFKHWTESELGKEELVAWDTPDGPLSVETHGALALALESFDEAAPSSR